MTQREQRRIAKRNEKNRVRQHFVEQLLPTVKPPTPWKPYQERFINDPVRRRVWVKSAQIGGSSAVAAWALYKCLSKPKSLVVILSASKPQAKEVILKIADFIRAIRGVEMSVESGERVFEEVKELVHSIDFPNRSRIIAVAAKPATARGYTGHIVLDEFAHCPNDEEVFTAAYRQITHGYDMLVVSTPNGQRGRFWKMAKELGLHLGVAPPYQPVVVKGGSWSGHWTDINLAVKEGLRVDPEEIRAGCDELTFRQEYLCEFLAEHSLWITPDLLESCIDRMALTGPPPLHRSNLFAGWDMASTGHHSTLWFTELMGDISLCVGVVNIAGQLLPIQLGQARAWMPQVARINVDQSGMGLAVSQALTMQYPGKAEGVQFTQAIKEQMAVYVRVRMEQRKLLLPNDETVRRAFLALRRSTNKIGQARFDAESDKTFGHADEFWACALAEMAAERGVSEVARSQAGQSDVMFDSQAKGPLSNFMNRPL